MKYNNIIFLGLCLGLTTYSALSADSVIKISGRVLDYGCTVSSQVQPSLFRLRKVNAVKGQRGFGLHLTGLRMQKIILC